MINSGTVGIDLLHVHKFLIESHKTEATPSRNHRDQSGFFLCFFGVDKKFTTIGNLVPHVLL